MTPDSESGRRALITGVTGQDAYYLALSLLQRGWTVFGGLARNESNRNLPAELRDVSPLPFELTDECSADVAVRLSRPDAIFHLAALSHVPASWDRPAETVRINTLGTLKLIEAQRRHAPESHLVFAGSSDCYDHAAAPLTGLTPACPYQAANPYAASKMAAMELAKQMRAARELRVSVAILMNHTSPRRPVRFIERKIVHDALAVARGKAPALVLGSLETRRDWSWAPDIVEGLRLMAAQPASGDFVLGSGELHSTGDWVRRVFRDLGLNDDEHLRIDPGLMHRADTPKTFGDIRPARKVLGWEPSVSFESMVDQLIDAENRAAQP